MVEFNKYSLNNSNEASHEEKPNIGVSSSLKETLESLVKGNLGIPNLYSNNSIITEKWLNSIESLQDEISEKRLYNLAKQSLKGEMKAWFNAFEGDTFDCISDLLKFFKEEFIKDDKNKEIKLWELIINKPANFGLVRLAYEVKSLNKTVNVSFKTIKDRFKLWLPHYLHEKLDNSENWSNLIELLRDNENSSLKKYKNETTIKNKSGNQEN
ncbi:hypothetical protein DMUE_4719 [Dictyocoela muelleri]|nr:hypothetical protein DMUE_4719 [Dictyocoela muelleri]